MDGAYEIADADRKTFFTKAGRPVKDGGGASSYFTVSYVLYCSVVCITLLCVIIITIN